MKEVEAKARLRDRVAVLEALTKLKVELGEPVVQRDTIYVQKTGSIDDYLDNTVFLRLRRTTAPGALFTAKYNPHRRSQALSGDFVALEKETRVDNPDIMHEILAVLGYQQAVEVVKSRRVGKHEQYEICLDDIDGVGSFVEVELLTDAEDTSVVHEQLWEFLGQLGIGREDQMLDRYDILMLKSRV